MSKSPSYFMKIITATHVATTLLQLSKHLHHHRHGDLAGLTSRSEVVDDGDATGMMQGFLDFYKNKI